jgi:AraC-like DNA-binding protein
MTPGEILRDRLTLEAKRLLAHSEFTVGETAQRLGFLSAAQFSNWFKREAGVSPDQFRKDFRAA